MEAGYTDVSLSRRLAVLLSGLMIELARGRKARSTTMEVVAARALTPVVPTSLRVSNSQDVTPFTELIFDWRKHNAMLREIHALCSSLRVRKLVCWSV